MTASVASRVVVCAFLFYCSITSYAASVTDEESLAAAVAEGGTVQVASTQIRLTRPVSVTRDTVIEARGGRATISGENTVRIFEVANDVKLTLIGLNLVNGRSTNGGAIYNDGGNLTVIDCRFLNN